MITEAYCKGCNAPLFKTHCIYCGTENEIMFVTHEEYCKIVREIAFTQHFWSPFETWYGKTVVVRN